MNVEPSEFVNDSSWSYGSHPAMYNQNGTFVYTTDKFLEYLSASEFNTLTNDEAQRCRLVTYYTFKNIPLTENWKVLIKYRIYAN